MRSGRRTASVAKVAQTLYDRAAAQHIGKGCDVLAVFDRFMERFGELLGNKDRKVCILALLIRIRMAIDRHEAIVIFRDDEAVRVHAEGADAVVEVFGEINELGLIAEIGDRFINFSRRFYADTDVDSIRLRLEAQSLRLAGKPFSTVTARSGNEVLAVVRFSASHNTKDAAVLIRQNRVDRRLSDDSHIIRQAVSHMGEDFAVHIRPQMTDAGQE